MTAVRTVSSRGVRERPARERSARLRLVLPAAPRELGWRATIAVCVVCSIGALGVSVAVQGQRISLQEDADRIASRTAVARDRNRQLRIEVIQAESPEHILDAARKAGMVEPGPIAVIPAAVPPEGTPPATVPSAPTAQSTPPTTAPRRTQATVPVARVAAGPTARAALR